MTDKVIVNNIDVSKCKYFGGFGAECLKQDLMLSCDEHPNCEYKQICKYYEQKLQAQKDFITQEQRKIYCAGYDKTCETGNNCKQKNCVFKDSLKYKQALEEIQKIVNADYYQDSWGALAIKIDDIKDIIKKEIFLS